MSSRPGSLACLLILAIPFPAMANWFRSRPSEVAVSSSYLGPTICVPSYALLFPVTSTPVATTPFPVTPGPLAPIPGTSPMLADTPRSQATPVPAPPSGEPGRPTPTPPPMPPASETRQSQSYYDAYAASATGSTTASGTCSVGFWNSTSRSVTVRVAGKVQVISPGRGVTLELPRSFSWQLDDRQPQQASTPSDQAGLDIVIRR
jgi:hypothetical protein